MAASVGLMVLTAACLLFGLSRLDPAVVIPPVVDALQPPPRCLHFLKVSGNGVHIVGQKYGQLPFLFLTAIRRTMRKTLVPSCGAGLLITILYLMPQVTSFRADPLEYFSWDMHLTMANAKYFTRTAPREALLPLIHFITQPADRITSP